MQGDGEGSPLLPLPRKAAQLQQGGGGGCREGALPPLLSPANQDAAGLRLDGSFTVAAEDEMFIKDTHELEEWLWLPTLKFWLQTDPF